MSSAIGSSNHRLGKLLRNDRKYDPGHIQSFKEALTKSGQYSIDSFLAEREEYRELGKIVIAYILLEAEETSLNQASFYKNHTNNRDENWYKYFFKNIKGLKEFNFCIYSFNYERSFEYYLTEAYKNLFNYTAEQISDLLQAMKITHLHGSLGEIKSPEDIKNLNYGNMEQLHTYSDMLKLSQGIEIIYEVVETKFKKLRNDIKNAENIVFIGFGFNQTNMNNIGIKDIKLDSNKKTIYTTTFGLYNNEIEYLLKNHLVVIEKLANGKKVVPSDVILKLFNDTALSFLRHKLPSHTYFDAICE